MWSVLFCRPIWRRFKCSNCLHPGVIKLPTKEEHYKVQITFEGFFGLHFSGISMKHQNQYFPSWSFSVWNYHVDNWCLFIDILRRSLNANGLPNLKIYCEFLTLLFSNYSIITKIVSVVWHNYLLTSQLCRTSFLCLEVYWNPYSLSPVFYYSSILF